ncbi:MAG: VWA domain-containing protein [Saprospiraceae bacterium]|nr:VWA domain-containing protein [Saprospiraceae bacterium]MDG2419513.1 VWA domain-containing protein [Saprospiraceae bacterium]
MSVPFIENYNFLAPYWLLGLTLLPIMAAWYLSQREKRYVNLNLPSLEAFEKSSLRGRLRVLLPILRALTVVTLFIAMARPQLTLQEEEITADGVDIMMVMDLSSSMLAQDFTPDRLEVSKDVAADFIDKRKYDRIGLAVFSGEAFTQCPLTTDHRILKEFLDGLQCGILQDGTAIGMGLSTAVNRLKDSEAKSKIVILLTDGDNNAGYIKPITAGEIARELDVKVYTIGIGSKGAARTPIRRRSNGDYVYGMSQVNFDEDLLRELSKMTGGQYFRAVSKEGLEEIYQIIDQLEKTKIDVTTIKRYSEEFYLFALLGIIFLVLEVLLRYTIFRTIP